MFWMYFKWQWLRDPYDTAPRGLQGMLAGIYLLLGIAGGYAHYKRDRWSFGFFGPLMFTITLALIFYMNFKYGYSQSPELGNTVPREVRDRDYFYLWGFSAWSVWAGLGIVLVWEQLAALLSPESEGEAAKIPRKNWLLTTPVFLLAIVPLITNWSAASRHGDTFTRDWAADLLNSVEPYGVLITNGDNDTFPLWYAQEVEGVRKDVTVAVTSLLRTDWYVRQMIRRPIYPYDAAKGPAVYRGRSWPLPTGSPVTHARPGRCASRSHLASAGAALQEGCDRGGDSCRRLLQGSDHRVARDSGRLSEPAAVFHIRLLSAHARPEQVRGESGARLEALPHTDRRGQALRRDSRLRLLRPAAH